MYQFLEDHRKEYTIVKMPRVLFVFWSEYYRWRLSDPTLENRRLQERIKWIWKESYKIHGSPRIHRQLRVGGRLVLSSQVARLMNQMAIASKIYFEWSTTIDKHHDLPVAPKLPDLDFMADQLKQALMSDKKYLSKRSGWLYLTTIIDLTNYQIIGWVSVEGSSAEQTSIAAFKARHISSHALLRSDSPFRPKIQYDCYVFTTLLTNQPYHLKHKSKRQLCAC